MNSEKVKEIKECLENCINDCGALSCPYDKYERGLKCIEDLQKDCLTLIKELESENERLKNSEKGELIKENDDLEKQCMKWSELDFKRRNKIKELKDRIAELEKVYDRQVRIINDLNIEVVKEQKKLPRFAERLKECASQHYVSQNGVRISDITYSISDGTINKILKEFIGER